MVSLDVKHHKIKRRLYAELNASRAVESALKLIAEISE